MKSLPVSALLGAERAASATEQARALINATADPERPTASITDHTVEKVRIAIAEAREGLRQLEDALWIM